MLSLSGAAVTVNNCEMKIIQRRHLDWGSFIVGEQFNVVVLRVEFQSEGVAAERNVSLRPAASQPDDERYEWEESV